MRLLGLTIALSLVLAASVFSQPTKPLPGAQVDWGNAINRGLELWLLFNEGAGSQLYDIANRHHGVLTNMNPASDWVSGLYGPALEFDGSNDHILISHDSRLAIFTTPFSVAFWIYGDTSTGSYSTIWSKGTSVRMHRNASGGGLYFLVGGLSDTVLTTSSGVFDDQWHHVIALWDGGNKTIYVDGVLNGTEVATGTPTGSGTSDFDIARNSAGNPYLTGMISGFQLYGRAIALTEVERLPSAPFDGILILDARMLHVAAAAAARRLIMVQD